MKLQDLSPVPGSHKAPYRKGRAQLPATERLRAKVTRVRRRVPAAVSVRVLKAARCLCRDVFRNVGLPMLSLLPITLF